MKRHQRVHVKKWNLSVTKAALLNTFPNVVWHLTGVWNLPEARPRHFHCLPDGGWKRCETLILLALGPGMRDAQKELFERVGDDQLIWCFVRKEDSKWRSVPNVARRYEWELDVPFAEVIEIISELEWSRIFGTHRGHAPKHLWTRLFLKDRFSGIDESAIAWHPDANEATALVRHPVPEAYVTRRPALGI